MRLHHFLTVAVCSLAGCSCSETPQPPDPAQYWDPTVRVIPNAHATDIRERFKLSGHELTESIAGFKMFWTYVEHPPDDPNVTFKVVVDGRGPQYLESINATCVNFGKKDTNEMSCEFFVMVARNVYKGPEARQLLEWIRANKDRTAHTYLRGWRFDVWGLEFMRHMKIRAQREEDQT